MKKKITLITNVLVFISLLILVLSNNNQNIIFSYVFILFFSLMLFSLVFITSMIINKKEFYKKSINIYLLIYFILLILLTMFINRNTISFNLIDIEYLKSYINSINIIPFKTIIGYLTSDTNAYITIYNIFGNLLVLIPLSLLIIIKDKKYENIKNQFYFLGITVLSIETLQFITSVGIFDIDDIILNIGGALLFIIVINKLKLVDKIRVFFYKDFNVNAKVKYTLYLIISILIVMCNVIIITSIYLQ